jgi:hypothetical protein
MSLSIQGRGVNIMSPRFEKTLVKVVAVGLAIVLSAAPSFGQTKKVVRPVADPLKCGCNCKCVANAMFSSKKHALSWAKAYYEKCGCG